MSQTLIKKLTFRCIASLSIGIALTALFVFSLGKIAGHDDRADVSSNVTPIAFPTSNAQLEKVTQQMLGSAAPSPADASRLNDIAPAAGAEKK